MRALRLSTAPDERTGHHSGVRVAACGAAGWRAVERLARGSTAEVWRAVDAAGREAALKRPREELRARPEMAAVLAAEHRWLVALGGAPFVTPLDYANLQGVPTLVLEYLPGGDLVSLIGAPAARWLPALRTVARALAALHARGAAHGDLKARNVLFAADGTARVIDLGGVRPLDGPAGPGTAAYRPAVSAVTGRRADAFALAALAFELCSARLPYGRAGQAFVGQEPPDVASGDTAMARLVSTARRELAGGGARGLSPLVDVIESVRAG
jgi:serine/threonine protein kinase